jgi:hypothetical protein
VRRLVKGYVDHYSDIRVNGADGSITSKDRRPGQQLEINAERDWNLKEPRQRRQLQRSHADCADANPAPRALNKTQLFDLLARVMFSW